MQRRINGWFEFFHSGNYLQMFWHAESTHVSEKFLLETSVIRWGKLVFPNGRIYFCIEELGAPQNSIWVKCEEVNEDFVLSDTMNLFLLPKGYQSSHKAQHEEALPGRWLCSEGTAKGHLCALRCYEYQGSGTRRHEWGRQHQVQVWSWLKSKANLCCGQRFCVNLRKTTPFSVWNLSKQCSCKGVGMAVTCTFVFEVIC